MNYYIQGCAAKADKIKAAFEKLGYDVTGFDMCNDNILFFTYKLQTGANVISTTNAHLYTANIIKTHPDYKELELPAEPKFKVGDWLYRNTLGVLPIIVEDYSELQGYKVVCRSTHYCLQKGVVEREYHLWTIADAKDGDVLVSPDGSIIIYAGKIADNGLLYDYVALNKYKILRPHEQISVSWLVQESVKPATKEQRDLLFKKMKEAGYQWDVNKKELRKIQLHYDIANFKPFDKVLVRQNDSSTWGISFFGFFSGIYMCCSNVWYEQCIPFNDDTKHLLGTSDPCDEQYINW